MQSTNIVLLTCITVLAAALILLYRYHVQSRKKSAVLESKLTLELTQSLLELRRYRDFAEEILPYIGTYPNWKVLIEFRELLIAVRTDRLQYVQYHLLNIDSFLNRLSSASLKLSHRENICPKDLESHLLDELRNLYPECVKWEPVLN